jgi:signal transduction histidine kinase
VVQQRTFRHQGLVRFGQDALWAAVAFGWYGLGGQSFPQPSLLPPSTVVNSELFLQIFGFPVQLFRAAMAIGAAIFVIRFLRAFQVEIDHQIADLQTARLHEAEEREKLRSQLFMRIVAAQESERQRIARELHDETGQALTAIGMGLRGLSSSLKGNKEEQKQTVQGLRQLESLTAQSLNELQRLITDLRPSHLDDLGLPSALRWYASDIEGRTSLVVQVEFTGKEREIGASIKTAIFRIVQEALTNVIRHAGAKHVFIKMAYLEEELQVQVRDDGNGFDPRASRKDRRIPWGLKGMEERAALLGGQFTLQSRPGQGTTVQVSVPYEQDTTEA